MAAHKFDIEDKKKEIREDLNRLAKILGRSPTSKDYKQQNNGKWSYTQILYLYGNWNVAVKDAGLNPNPSQAPPKPEIITKDELAKEFIIISNTLGKIPSMREFGAASKYSTRPYTNSFGKWIDAVNYMTDNYLDKFSFPIDSSRAIPANSKTRKKLKWDCSLLYEPSNEFETIALFICLSNLLGFKIKEIKAAFPDAVLVQSGKDVLAEFEYLSSNYLQHGHPLDKQYLCICWRRDIDLENVRILSLEEFIRKDKN
ncbi:MAG TPA: hypothetical protein PKW92_01825 [Smithella sp.]|nr:hypothetical protein [Smithella sp.]